MAEKKIQTAQQKLNNFLRSELSHDYPLTSDLKILLHALASYCYYRSDCTPSASSLLSYTSWKDWRTLDKNLCILESFGLIKIVRKKGCRNHYFWLVPEISDEEIYKKKAVDKCGKTKN